MLIQNITDGTLKSWQRIIGDNLRIDDEKVVAGEIRTWCVRDTVDWREIADEVEQELRARKIDFTPIDWSDLTTTYKSHTLTAVQQPNGAWVVEIAAVPGGKTLVTPAHSDLSEAMATAKRILDNGIQP